ncbi:zinc-binding dehydrogenase [Sphingobium sp. CR2-8]|uniref:zinc-binding dehydrogenase n=1 Tax=Sphingobium sp. CR2-8 TaxID=1306534 RepID=UPI002DBC2AA3|nr:zinc-binding dehydrogenase [Sphingobium sp. CR2-8]MEC3909385.1 zinc-binding dehydrogenase [Sphingobium sp. CR2-8]
MQRSATDHVRHSREMLNKIRPKSSSPHPDLSDHALEQARRRLEERVSAMTMQAVVMQQGMLNLARIPTPIPRAGEVLVKTLACGICGSDLHCVTHSQQLIDSTRAVTGGELFDINEPVVLGHEICAEVVDYGPGTRKVNALGSRVVSVPFLPRPQPVMIGLSGVETPGGFAEFMILSEDLLIPVPDDLPADIATLAEPMAVAVHAINRGNLGKDDVPIVIGCGPIGLAIIAVLKMRGIGPIVAADFSPSRRKMAERLGADVVVDPRETSPYDSWRGLAGASDPARLGRQTQLFMGFPFRQSVIFECVGVPGIIQQILANAPPCSKVVVAGVCLELDQFIPVYAIFKEIDLIFCITYTPDEFAQTFAAIASGKLDVAPLITSRVGLDGVAGAFASLADPERDAKIVVVPH